MKYIVRKSVSIAHAGRRANQSAEDTLKLRRIVKLFFLLVLLGTTEKSLEAQAEPTASRPLRASAFALLGDTYTGLGGSFQGYGGRNFSLTAGLDLGVVNVHRVEVGVEARGTYPLNSGEVDGQKSVLGGLRFSRTFAEAHRNNITPYVDLLAGRGSMNYVNGGYRTPSLVYSYSASGVYSAGGGFQLRLTSWLAFEAEAQFQQWSTPVLASGRITAKQPNAGFVYTFGTRDRER